MNRTGAFRALLALLLIPVIGPTAAALPVRTIHYDVSVGDPAVHRFHVVITLPASETGETGPAVKSRAKIVFAIPAWSPGYYQILQYEKNIAHFHAVDASGKALGVTQPDAHSWAVTETGGTIQAAYDVTANDAGYGFFGSHLDDKTGYINGASALMYVVGDKNWPATITFHVPNHWRIATPLDPDAAASSAPGDAHDGAAATPATYRADDYDALIDAPVQMGEFGRLDFTVDGTPYAAILVGAQHPDRARLKDVLSRVGAAGIRLFGYPPFKRYCFFMHFKPGSFSGGLEHRNSTVLNLWPRYVENPRFGADLVAHEYFHAWNVKRLHPAVLGPFDYTQKVRTGALWFCEGVTDYYAWVLTRMAGLTSASDFEQEMGDRIHQLQHTDARKQVSAEEASKKSWEGGSMGYGGLSYYLKGSLLGLLLDIEIRDATDDAKSLDDVMRYLDQQYGRPGRGYEEDALLKAINEVSGRDFTEFYDRYVRGTDEIPWNVILREAGFSYEEESEKRAFLGVSTEQDKDDLVIRTVTLDSAAAKAGLREGDRLATLNGAKIRADGFEDAIRTLQPGQRITLGLRRAGEWLQIPATLGERTDTSYRLRAIADADEKARRVRSGLLRETHTAAVSAPAGG